MIRSPSAGSISSALAFATLPAGPTSSRSSSTMYAGSSIRSGRSYAFQPTTPTRLPRPMPSPPRISASGQRPVARLARQAEVLVAVALHRERRGTGHAPALVAHQDRGRPGRAQDQHRLLEAGVEARSGTRGSRCARGRRRRRGGRTRPRRPGPGAARRAPRTAPPGARGARAGTPKSGRSTVASRTPGHRSRAHGARRRPRRRLRRAAGDVHELVRGHGSSTGPPRRPARSPAPPPSRRHRDRGASSRAGRRRGRPRPRARAWRPGRRRASR